VWLALRHPQAEQATQRRGRVVGPATYSDVLRLGHTRYPPYLHLPVTASVFWATALRVQEFDKSLLSIRCVPPKLAP